MLIPQQEGLFDLALQVIERKDRLVFLLKYSSDVFKEKTVRRVSENFKRLLDSIITRPEQQIGAMPLLCKAEKNLIRALYQPARQQIEKLPLTKWFEQTVARTPEKTALRYRERTISYSRLNQRAEIVASKLLERDLKPQTLVALQLEPSIEMVVAILGILKAGRAYLPLDRSLPPNRIHAILEESRPDIIISRRNLNDYTGQFNLEWIWIEDINFNEERSSDFFQKNNAEISVRDPAYVIFTSGSTGKPKGVVVTHANVSHLLTHMLKKVEFSYNDTWTLCHSVSFDYSVWELWGAFASGGAVVISPPEVTKDIRAFHKLVKQERVTVLNLTPAAFFQYIKADSVDATSDENNLRVVFLGGDRLDVKRLKHWFERHSDDSPKIINLYGITETTVITTLRQIKREDISRHSSPIGAPFDDSALYLLDENREEVPIGAKGEIYVAGDCVAAGYLNRPKPANEVFIKGSLRDPEEKMYRGGDIARMNAEGELEYLGRNDQQLKIRGYRIEPSEIETVAEKHKNVDQAVVRARKSDAEDMRLIIYLALKEHENELDEQALRSFFSNYLPNYMIPTHFVFLDHIPICDNGKIDYQKLPDPLKSRQPGNPPSESEETEILRKIWSRLLGKMIIDIDLDFFSAGGNSLSLMQLEFEIEKQFSRSIALSGLIRHSTIRGQGALIRDASFNNISTQEKRGWRKKSLKVISQTFSAGLIAVIARLISITVRIIELDKPKDSLEQPLQLAHWHGDGFMMLRAWRNKGLNLLVSKSPDGELGAAVVKKFGYKFVYGSSSSDAFTGILQLAQKVKEGESVALAVDGSRGPLHVVKPGIVELARQTQAPIQPVASVCDRGWVLEKSWDKFLIPKPFSKVVIKYGPSIPPPAPDDHLYSDSFQKTVQAVEEALKQTKKEIKESFLFRDS